MSSGIVTGNVYGGGLGVTTRMSGNQSTYANIFGDAMVGGNVYGGAAYGLVSGASVSTNVTIGTSGDDTCIVEGSVYGGGKGIAGYESVIGVNNVTINGGTIGANAYGGSELGITTGNVFVTINGGNSSHAGDTDILPVNNPAETVCCLFSADRADDIIIHPWTVYISRSSTYSLNQ